MRNILISTTLALAFSGAAVAPTPAASAVLQPGFGAVYTQVSFFNELVPVTVPSGRDGTFAGLDFDRDTDLRTRSDGSGVTTSERARAAINVSGVTPPQVEALAFAQATRSGLSGGTAIARARAALVFEFLVTGSGSSILQGLIFDTVPLLATIQISLRASTTGTAGNPNQSRANARAEVAASYDPIGIDDSARLSFDRTTAETVAGGVTAISDGDRDDEFSPPTPIFYALDAEVGRRAYIGKAVEVNATARVGQGIGAQVSSEVGAILDPLIIFDQARFQALYGADCAAAGLSLCPEMSSLFSLQLSPGLDPNATASPIPLPASVWLLATALGGLALRARRSEKA